jgi:ABC-2 type transport system permease protein
VASVANLPGPARQLWLVVAVRWQIFRNGLRSSSEAVHTLGSVVLGLFYAVLALGGSALICFGSYAIVKTQNWIVLSLLLWGIFLFWQLAPVMVSGMNPGFDGRNLLRFPLSFSAFFLLNLAYGIADPFAIAGILWHAAMGVGISIARPDLFGWNALALGVSVIMNLLFNRLIFSWLERILAKRLMREIVTALFVLFFVGLQFSGFMLQREGPAVRRALRNTAGVWSNLPPALAGTAIEQAAADDSLAALRAVGLLGIYSAAFGAFYAIRVRAQFTGEDLGESAAPARPRPTAKRIAAPAAAQGAPVSRASSLGSGIFSGPVEAIFIKELRYFYRNSMLMMNMFMPLILIAFFILPSSMQRRPGAPSFFSRFGGDFAYPAAVAYIALLMMNFCPNNLAYEGRGIERLYLAPVKFRDVMLGKNLFHGALLALESVFALILVSVMGHPPSAVILLATWSALLFSALIDLGAGNWLSLQFPRRFEFGVRRQRPSGLTTIISFGVFFAKMLVIAGAAYLCIWLAGPWLLPVAYIALSAAAFALYRLILEGTTRQAIQQRDALLEQLSR